MNLEDAMGSSHNGAGVEISKAMIGCLGVVGAATITGIFLLLSKFPIPEILAEKSEIPKSRLEITASMLLLPTQTEIHPPSFTPTEYQLPMSSLTVSTATSTFIPIEPPTPFVQEPTRVASTSTSTVIPTQEPVIVDTQIPTSEPTEELCVYRPGPGNLTPAEKLKDLNDQNMEIKEIFFSDDCSIVILVGENAYWIVAGPTKFVEKMSTLNEEAENIRQVALIHEFGYVILYGDKAVAWLGLPQNLEDKISELYDRGETIKQIAVTDQLGWVVLYGGNGYSAIDIPDTALDKLSELNSSNLGIDHISFTNNGGWVILYEKGAVWNSIPESAVSAIKDLYAQGKDVKWISFTPDLDWVILYGRNGYWAHGIP